MTPDITLRMGALNVDLGKELGLPALCVRAAQNETGEDLTLYFSADQTALLAGYFLACCKLSSGRVPER